MTLHHFCEKQCNTTPQICLNQISPPVACCKSLLKKCETNFSSLIFTTQLILWRHKTKKKIIQWSLKCPLSHLKVPLSASCQSATLSNPRSEVTKEGFCSPDARELRHNSSLCAWVHVWAGEEGGSLSAPFKGVYLACVSACWGGSFQCGWKQNL